MKSHISGVLTFALVLGACAAADSAGTSPSTHVGTSESALVARLGPPASIEEAGGTRYLGYRQTRASYLPAVTPFYQPICPPSVCVPIGGVHGFMLKQSCTTIFAVSDGKVAGWRREGAACGAEPAK